MRWALIFLVSLLLGPSAQAETVRVAVAANFRSTLAAVEPLFSARTGHVLAISAGSTGALANQILQGAPFDVFLAADSDRPGQLLARGKAVEGSQVTYAIGGLVLILGEPSSASLTDILRNSRRIALANPRTAPYGRAAEELLGNLGLYEVTRDKLVFARNVSAVAALVDSGAAEVGFTALPTVIAYPDGSFLTPEADLYKPIEQVAVLLERGRDNTAAQQFLAFLVSGEARAVILAHGYGVE